MLWEKLNAADRDAATLSTTPVSDVVVIKKKIAFKMAGLSNSSPLRHPVMKWSSATRVHCSHLHNRRRLLSTFLFFFFFRDGAPISFLLCPTTRCVLNLYTSNFLFRSPFTDIQPVPARLPNINTHLIRLGTIARWLSITCNDCCLLFS